jgi:hypothetical protein
MLPTQHWDNPYKRDDRMKRRTFLALCVVIALLFTLILPKQSVKAYSLTPQDLINLINDWRVNRYGFTPLVVNSILMGTAQSTADYMASNHLLGHWGNVSGRVMAAGYGGGKQVFATENWAMGTNGLTIDEVAAYWEDEAHQYPAAKEQYQEIGAAVADGPWGEYYVVHAAVSLGNSVVSTIDPNITPVATISNVVSPIITSTPLADGTIYHEVLAGQSLWAIAVAYFGPHPDMTSYEEQIMKQNGMTLSNNIWPGDKLLIQPSLTPTVSPTVTPSPIPPTRTPTPPLAMMTVVPTRTATPTATPEPPAGIVSGLDRRTLGTIIVIVCGVGLSVVVALSLIRQKPKKPQGS